MSDAEVAASVIAARTGIERHDVAVVLGSGWGPAADAIGAGVEVPMSDLVGFPAPTVRGHEGAVRSVKVGRSNVLRVDDDGADHDGGPQRDTYELGHHFLCGHVSRPRLDEPNSTVIH